jgi:alkylation response protein AidB-like acyl-CoA dehydrogenase
VIGREIDEAGAPLADDPHLRRRLAMMEIEIAAIEATERSNLTQPAGSGRYSRGVAASIQKLKVSAMIQRLAELSVEAIGPHAMVDYRARLYGEEGDDGVLAGSLDPRATVVARHMNMRATTIYGGASEIQRGIVARHALGF